MSRVQTIPADFNAANEDGSIRLDTHAAKMALRDVQPFSGMSVTLDDEELSIEAVLIMRMHGGHEIWTAELVGKFKDV